MSLHIAERVLKEPKLFFKEDIRSIHSWKEPIRYVVSFTLFITIFLSFHYLSNFQSLSLDFYKQLGVHNPFPLITPSVPSYITVYIVAVVLLTGLSFLRYWITHWYVYLWNKKATYKTTYKALAYSTTPGWIGIPFFVISSYLFFFALKTGGTGYWALSIISGIISLSFELYSMYIRTYALAHLQNITRLKSFLALYVLGLITYTAIIFVVELLVLLIIFL